MSKRKAPKKLVLTSEMIFDRDKPRFNGFACGHGAHGSKKYDRRKANLKFKEVHDL